MTDFNNAIQSVIDRVQASAATASPNDLVYLAKAIEAAGPASAVSFLVQLGDSKKTEITTLANAKEGEITTLANAKEGEITDLTTSKKSEISTLAATVLAQLNTIVNPEWLVKASDYTAQADERIAADTSTASFTITLPANPRNGCAIFIHDVASAFATHNLSVARNGKNIMGVAEDIVLDVGNATARFVYINATYGWRLI